MKKKMAWLLVFVIITLTMAPVVDAVDINTNDFYFLSTDVPQGAIAYAKYYFTTFTVGELLELGFTYDEIQTLHLAPPLTAYEYDECDDSYYYFPVLADDNIVAMLTMIDLGEDNYAVQFGKSDFANALNQIETTSTDPGILVISDDAMYVLNNSNEFTMVDDYKKNLTTTTRKISVNPDITFNAISSHNNVMVSINEDTVYTETINFKSARTIVQNNLNVPIVPNGTTAAFPGGYCWVSSLASIIHFRTNMDNMTATEARDVLLRTFGNPPTYIGYDYEVKELMETYVSANVTLLSGTGMMQFDDIKNCIDNNKPIYTDWQYFADDPSESSAHAMVVRGYNYDSTLSGPGIEKATIMDPNYSYYQSINLYPAFRYRIGTGSYEWYSSVY